MTSAGSHTNDGLKLDRIEDAALKETLIQAFALPMVLELSGTTPRKRAVLISAEAEKLTRLLQSSGYLEAEVDISHDPASSLGVRYSVFPGKMYRIGWIRMIGLPVEAPEKMLVSFDDFAARYAGQTATKAVLREMEEGLVWRLRDASYAAGEIIRIDRQMEPETRTVGLSIVVSAGQSFRIGGVQLQGSRHADTLAQFASSNLRHGSPYSPAATESLRGLLEATQLFERVNISFADKGKAAGFSKVMEVDLVDRVPEPHFLQTKVAFGPVLSIVAMLLIMIRECTGPHAAWSGKPVGPMLSGAVFLFYFANIIFISIIIYFMIFK